jgi:hypothetical protein
MRSKRGGTLAVEEIVKLVIGIGVFIFILFILFALGKIVASNLKEEQARNTLDTIVYEIGKMTDGQTKEVFIESPKGWVIMANNTEVCFCSPISKLYSSSVIVDPVLQNKVFGICKAQNICKSINLDASISTSCVNSWGSIANCLQITQVPYGLQVDKGSSVVKLYPSSLGGAIRTIYGSQNPGCSFSTDSIYYDQTLIKSDGRFLVRNINPSFKDCKLELLRDSVIRFDFVCDDSFLQNVKYVPHDSVPECNILSIQDTSANFSCFLNEDVLAGKDSTKCDLEISVEWDTVDCSKTYLEGGGSRCPIQKWKGLSFKLDKTDVSCSIKNIGYESYSNKLGYDQFYFIFETNCAKDSFKEYLSNLKNQVNKYNITFYHEGNPLESYSYLLFGEPEIENFNPSSLVYLYNVSFILDGSYPITGDYFVFSYPNGQNTVSLRSME